MFKSYYDVRNWLESFIPYTYSKENLGLERISYLLKLLGNPQKKFKSILVAGTSGKGSTAFYIAQLLRNCKSEILNPLFARKLAQSKQSETKLNVQNPNSQKVLSLENSNFDIVSSLDIRASNFPPMKVGLHVSPHLSYIGERMQIDSQLISVKRLVKLVNEIKPLVEKIKKMKPDLIPSYFEILVAASFLYFAQEKVDWAVVEVGLGGRLDATNVLTPKLSVITNVGLDHTDILGNTIEKIAFEKAGIIKKNTPVVTAATGRALKVIEKVAKSKNAPLIKVNTRLGVQPLKSVAKDYVIIYRDIERYIGKSFASANFLLAFTTVLALGFRPSKKAVSRVSRLTFPGRFEQIEKGIILDGAHNVDKVKALINAISNWSLAISKETKGKGRKPNGIILVVAFKKGKSWKKMLDLLLKNLQVKRVIATKFHAVTDTGKFAAVDPKEIAAYAHGQGVSLTGEYSNSQEAVFEAINECVIASEAKQSKILNQVQDDKKEIATSLDSLETRNDKCLVLVTGSLYLVGEAGTSWFLPSFA